MNGWLSRFLSRQAHLVLINMPGSSTERVGSCSFSNTPGAVESSLAPSECSASHPPYCASVWSHTRLSDSLCFLDIQANIKGLLLSSGCTSCIPEYLPSLMFLWCCKSIGPSAPLEVVLPSGFAKLGQSLLLQRKWLVNLSYVEAQCTIMSLTIRNALFWMTLISFSNAEWPGDQ